MQQGKRGGNSWVGWLIFFFVIFGSRFLGPVATWLSQATGLAITPPMLIAAVIGVSVIASLAGSAVSALGKAQSSGETRLPTSPPLAPPGGTSLQRQMSPPRQATPPPTTQLPPQLGSSLPPSRLPTGEQRLPTPPRFEPIIDPRILSFGIVGLLVIGGLFGAALLLLGAMP